MPIVSVTDCMEPRTGERMDWCHGRVRECRTGLLLLLLVALLWPVQLVAALPGGGRGFVSIDDPGIGSFAVFTGTVHDGYLVKSHPDARILHFDGSADMVLALKTGKADVALLDQSTALLLVRHNAELGVLQRDVLQMPLGIGFSKINTELRDRFNRFLAESRSDGSYDRIYRRWFIDDPEAALMPPFRPASSGRTVRLGVSVDDLPYVAMMQGKYSGFDIELLQRFAEHESLNIEMVSLEFSALVTALASGKVDMIADGIAITAERAKLVDFSDPYLYYRAAAIARLADIAPERMDAVPDLPSGGSGLQGGGSAASLRQPPAFLRDIMASIERNLLVENRWRIILDGFVITMIISFFATIAGTLTGAVVCYLRMSPRSLLRIPALIFISFLRGTPVLVVLMIIFYVVFASVNIDPVIVAIIAFGLNFGAYAAEIFRAGIESIDRGQSEAGIAMGFSQARTFQYIILPQMIQRILPIYRGEFISLVKMTSIVGYIAVQDLTKAGDIVRSRTFDAFFPLVMVAILYFLLSWFLMLFLEYVERKTDPRQRRNQQREA